MNIITICQSVPLKRCETACLSFFKLLWAGMNEVTPVWRLDSTFGGLDTHRIMSKV